MMQEVQSFPEVFDGTKSIGLVKIMIVLHIIEAAMHAHSCSGRGPVALQTMACCYNDSKS